MTRDERRIADMVLGAIIGYFVTKALATMERASSSTGPVTGRIRPGGGR